MAAKRKIADREKLELDYRAGALTFREMAAKHGLSAGRIKQIADEERWDRDLARRIQQVAEAKLNRALLNAEAKCAISSPQKKATEAEIVEAGSKQVFQIRATHRADIAKSRALAMRLMDELEAQTVQVPELAQLGDLMRAPEGADKLNDLYQKIISLPSRTKTMKDLGDTLRTLIGLEREAYGVDDGGAGGDQGTAARALTDAERAVRLARLLAQQEGAG